MDSANLNPGDRGRGLGVNIHILAVPTIAMNLINRDLLARRQVGQHEG